MAPPIEKLPTELVHMIVSNLNYIDASALRETSKRLSLQITNESIRHLNVPIMLYLNREKNKKEETSEEPEFNFYVGTLVFKVKFYFKLARYAPDVDNFQPDLQLRGLTEAQKHQFWEQRDIFNNYRIMFGEIALISTNIPTNNIQFATVPKDILDIIPSIQTFTWNPELTRKKQGEIYAHEDWVREWAPEWLAEVDASSVFDTKSRFMLWNALEKIAEAVTVDVGDITVDYLKNLFVEKMGNGLVTINKTIYYFHFTESFVYVKNAFRNVEIDLDCLPGIKHVLVLWYNNFPLCQNNYHNVNNRRAYPEPNDEIPANRYRNFHLNIHLGTTYGNGSITLTGDYRTETSWYCKVFNPYEQSQ